MELISITLAASLFLSIMLAPMGCMVVWRGMSFIGEALSHGALLGVALSTLLHLPMGVGIWLVSLLMVFCLQPLGKYLKVETLLACWMYVSLGLALWLLKDSHEDILWGDILTLTYTDLFMMALGTIVVVILIKKYWRLWLWYGLQQDMAQVEYAKITLYDRFFWMTVATVTALACQSVGGLLVPALFVLPASTVRPFVKTPMHMMVCSVMASLGAFLLAMPGVFLLDWPAGPAVVVILGVFCTSAYLFAYLRKHKPHAAIEA